MVPFRGVHEVSEGHPSLYTNRDGLCEARSRQRQAEKCYFFHTAYLL